MAIFGKPTARKESAKSAARTAKREPKVLSARELAAQAVSRKGKLPGVEPLGETSLRGASIIDWSTAPKAIEVAQANPGLCAVLENAALLFANGQDAAARELLEQGVATDQDTKLSPLAWLALFDLMQRANDRVAFDQLAMQYVVQFERSSPSWDETGKPATPDTPGAGGYIAITGRLSSQSAVQLEGLKRALEKCVPRARIDLSSVTGFDDAGARLLAVDLARARSQRMELAIQRPEKLRAALEQAVAKGRDGGEGAWLLSLELMQWHHEHADFDERAVEFAVAFELSPPSWEPPPRPQGSKRDDAPRDDAPAAGSAASGASAAADKDIAVFEGVLVGAVASPLARLADLASRNPGATIDMTRVERIDFICTGALLNAIARIEGQGKSVQILGASPIVRALLLLIGISPRHFVKKSV
ncbi:MAG TPA: STAS domain-containing protein [Casimicrobiaceae bacterium]|nr:STAS domain-containing protein [Casimicrobiaceae bacterium]